LSQSDEFSKFLTTMTAIEKQREFDRRVDRLKKSSSATTFWAVFPGLFGIHGIAHFYLNRPIEGLLILIGGILPGIFITAYSLTPFLSFIPWSFLPSLNGLGLSPDYLYLATAALVVLRLGFFIGNIISARYQYSRYDFYIHHRAAKPWDNWGFNSKT
jgi:hypothetical protein